MRERFLTRARSKYAGALPTLQCFPVTSLVFFGGSASLPLFVPPSVRRTLLRNIRVREGREMFSFLIEV